MTGDPLRKVSPGDGLRFPAAFYNELVDLALAGRIEGNPGEFDLRNFQQSGLIRVKNASGSDVSRFGVLAVSAPVFGPDDDLAQFLSEVILTGSAPNADGQDHFVICQEPIEDGGFGWAVISGITVARVNVLSGSDQFAETVSGGVTELQSSDNGSAEILWSDADGDEGWAIIRLSNTPKNEVGDSGSGSGSGTGSGDSGSGSTGDCRCPVPPPNGRDCPPGYERVFLRTDVPPGCEDEDCPEEGGSGSGSSTECNHKVTCWPVEQVTNYDPCGERGSGEQVATSCCGNLPQTLTLSFASHAEDVTLTYDGSVEGLDQWNGFQEYPECADCIFGDANTLAWSVRCSKGSNDGCNSFRLYSAFDSGQFGGGQVFIDMAPTECGCDPFYLVFEGVIYGNNGGEGYSGNCAPGCLFSDAVVTI